MGIHAEKGGNGRDRRMKNDIDKQTALAPPLSRSRARYERRESKGAKGCRVFESTCTTFLGRCNIRAGLIEFKSSNSRGKWSQPACKLSDSTCC